MVNSGRGRPSPRPPRGGRAGRSGYGRGDRRSSQNNHIVADDDNGELNAGLTERFGRGSAFRQRDQSRQDQPRIHANPKIHFYIKKRRIGEGSPRWTTRPEIPTAEELLPYPVFHNDINEPWETSDPWGSEPASDELKSSETAVTGPPPASSSRSKASESRELDTGLENWEAHAKAAEEWQEQSAAGAWGQTDAPADVVDVQWYENADEDEDHRKAEPANDDEWHSPAADENGWKNDPWASANDTKSLAPADDDEVESFENVFNKIDGPWPSKIEYLRSHYLLLREDALRPLREAVEHVRGMVDLDEDPSRSTIGIYDQVSVCGITLATKGLGIRIKFSLGRVGKNIRWQQTRRLCSGSLVVLMSPDKSKCKVAIVAARPLELVQRHPPELDLFFGRGEDVDVDCTQDWIMIEERSSFFEARRHTLVALQRMVDEKFPLSEQLVGLQPPVVPPKYVQDNPIRDFRSICREEASHETLQKVDMLGDWPSEDQFHLDESQMNALNTILTKRLSVVQGPPGTGKTYVSVQALKILVQNMAPEDPPIIISCHTNHALDQLLRHVATFETEFARIGGRSEDKDVILKRNIMELKHQHKFPPFKGLKSWRGLEAEVEKLITPLIKREAGPDSKEVFELALLRELGVLSQQQCDSVVEGAKEWVSHDNNADDDPLLKWLGKQIEPVKQRQLPVLVGYEDIDDDKMGFEDIAEQEAEQGAVNEDEDFDKLNGAHWIIGDTWTGRGSDNRASRDHARELLKTKNDMWKIRTADRGIVYRHIQRQAKAKITERLQKLHPQYKSMCDDRTVARWEFEESILKKQKVIGLTTTGVSKYRGLIQSLKPKVVLIEEAAETLEAPVIVTCMESVEHLILVGDHQQLRPNVHVHALEREPYNLNISMFERLVKNDFEYRILQRQRRMKPEIRRILKPIYGTKIKDHESVNKLAVRPPVPGMGGLNSWFFTHEYHDERDQEASSFNYFEAQMIIGLVQYLKYNGHPSHKITILTFYNGQRRLIRKLVKDDETTRGDTDMHNVQLKTVDSYQGEENDVIILSLVRSNMDNKIGFIGVENRVCVALSRAQRGFYIFGNGQLLCGESRLWSEVVTELYNGSVGKRTRHEERPESPEINQHLPDRRIGFSLPLWCSRHRRRFWIESAGDWQRNVGGCDLPCRGTLPCGHSCKERCHPWPHDSYKCLAPCTRRLACRHLCVLKCFELCECGHGCAEREGQGEGIASSSTSHNNITERSRPSSSEQSAVADPRETSKAADKHRAQATKSDAQVLIDVEDGTQQTYNATLLETIVTSDGYTRQRWESVWTPPAKKQAPERSLMD